MTVDTDFLDRCIQTLDTAFARLDEQEAGGLAREIVRAACVKEFELVLEQSGSLLRKRLRPYFASNQQVDRLTFKDLFRHAAKHGLISVEGCERWLAYRDRPLPSRRGCPPGLRRGDAGAAAGVHHGRARPGAGDRGGIR